MELRQKFLPDFIQELNSAVKAYNAFDDFLKRTEANPSEDFDKMPPELQATFTLVFRQVLAEYL